MLLEYIKNLENKDNRGRGQQVVAVLRELGLEPVLQSFPFSKTGNIIVDFCTNPESKRLLLSAHYDAVAGSPGANDNASGVAVLLGLSKYLKESPAPVRIVFFDREEAWFRTPLFRLGLLGSLYYIWKTNLKNISAVYNLELVGRGDFLSIWPVKENEKLLRSVKKIRRTAEEMKVPCRTAHIPWFILSSDHLSFRLKRMANAVSLSLLPADRVPEWEDILARVNSAGILFHRLPKLPEPLASNHTPRDSSVNLDENSLQLMLSLLKKLVSGYNFET